MSKCISRNGEFSDHELGEGTHEFTCSRCWAFDEDAAIATVAELRATIDRVRRETAMDWAGYFRTADSAVGWPTLTIARVIELLESGHEPFGCSAALDGGGQQ